MEKRDLPLMQQALLGKWLNKLRRREADSLREDAHPDTANAHIRAQA